MPTATTPEGVIEVDGKLWKPRRNATARAAEFIAARNAFREISLDSRWNPWVREAEATKQQAPKPEPLAVIPSGLPICEIIKRLSELQQQFPDAEVRRGRANRWEL